MKKEPYKNENRDLMSSIYDEFEKKGGAAKLPGMGKPLPKNALEGDIFSKIVKNANYLPAWLQRQKEIKKQIAIVMKLKDENQRIKEVERINQEIIKYNRLCPPALQKSQLSSGHLESQYKQWE
ncbi:DnaJ family domain-containing protein [Metabacillus sp. JX24]|uniref:DnaJ family domain-containing protein n=1 Tax=Metabacillus sp. JX24 TaxID=3240759 RepID=UPI00350FC52D